MRQSCDSCGRSRRRPRATEIERLGDLPRSVSRSGRAPGPERQRDRLPRGGSAGRGGEHTGHGGAAGCHGGRHRDEAELVPGVRRGERRRRGRQQDGGNTPQGSAHHRATGQPTATRRRLVDRFVFHHVVSSRAKRHPRSILRAGSPHHGPSARRCVFRVSIRPMRVDPGERSGHKRAARRGDPRGRVRAHATIAGCHATTILTSPHARASDVCGCSRARERPPRTGTDGAAGWHRPRAARPHSASSLAKCGWTTSSSAPSRVRL